MAPLISTPAGATTVNDEDIWAVRGSAIARYDAGRKVTLPSGRSRGALPAARSAC
jgi:hypothetical protein